MRASDRAYASLRESIIGWELAPGTVLGEVEQSTRLGVSRTPVREALARLTADGLVASQSGRGLVVTPVSLDDIVELFEARQLLEQKVAALAAERRDPAVFIELQRELRESAANIDGPAAKTDRAAYYELVARLDAATDAASRSPYLVAALRNLRTHFVRIRRLSQDDPQRLITAAGEHLLIVDAIVDGNAALAASATHIHLHQSLQNILKGTP